MVLERRKRTGKGGGVRDGVKEGRVGVGDGGVERGKA